jgi:predicted transcriptional regulator
MIAVYQILKILETAPEGLTTNQLSERIGLRSNNVSSKMSKLFAYGLIGRLKTKDERGRTETRWLIRPSRASNEPSV